MPRHTAIKLVGPIRNIIFKTRPTTKTTTQTSPTSPLFHCKLPSHAPSLLTHVHCTNKPQMPAKKAPVKKREAPEPSPTPSTPANKRARHDSGSPPSARKRQSSTAERKNLFEPPSDDEYAITDSPILNPQALDVLRQVEVCLYPNPT